MCEDSSNDFPDYDFDFSPTPPAHSSGRPDINVSTTLADGGYVRAYADPVEAPTTPSAKSQLTLNDLISGNGVDNMDPELKKRLLRSAQGKLTEWKIRLFVLLAIVRKRKKSIEHWLVTFNPKGIMPDVRF